MIPLVKADKENGYFAELYEEWLSQLNSEEGAPQEFYEPYMQQAMRILEKADPNYGIFVLRRDTPDASGHRYDGMIHVNYAWPLKTVRMVWSFLAPKYDQDEAIEKKVPRLIANFLSGGINICKTQWVAPSLKMYIPDQGNRKLAVLAAQMLEEGGQDFSIAVGGSWVHIDHIGEG